MSKAARQNRWLAIDPGPEQSGYVVYGEGKVWVAGVIDNTSAYLADLIWVSERFAVEMIASYGMAVGKDVFETCVWIGRFLEKYESPARKTPTRHAEGVRIFRRDVKLHLCGSPRAKDANVRQALIDRLGPVGTKRARGPLYSVKSHAWAALAVAVTADDTFSAGASK
jgi:hypothetical protein